MENEMAYDGRPFPLLGKQVYGEKWRLCLVVLSLVLDQMLRILEVSQQAIMMVMGSDCAFSSSRVVAKARLEGNWLGVRIR
jgi:hypothetical protein